MINSRKIGISILTVTVIMTTGCNQVKYNSTWKQQDIVIDGDDRDWQGAQIVPKKVRVALGVKNDADYLYLSFRTPEQSLMMQVLGQGFTVWVDPTGGKNEVWGIKYPVGGGMQEMGELMRIIRMSPDEADKQVEQLMQLQSFAQVIDPENRFQTIPLSQSDFITAKMSYSNGQLIYELKMPLAANPNDINGTGIEPGSVIGLGFTTPEMEMGAMMGGGPGGGGMGGPPGGGIMSGGGGGMGGGRGMGGPPSGGGNRQMPESLELWLKVALAKQG